MRTPCHSRAPHHGVIRCLVTILTASALCASWTASAKAQGKVDFARQIRPILAENCFECHGPDERGRKGKLRLDSRDDVFADRDGHRVVVAGDPEESELIARITSDDPDEVMPPPKSRRQLTKPQIELLTRWVGRGGPLERALVVRASSPTGNPAGVDTGMVQATPSIDSSSRGSIGPA